MNEPALRTFGPFQLDLTTGQLRRLGVNVSLQRQPARVLTTLVSRAGDLVSREDLREAVWDEATHVDFNRGLNYCIRHLRAALGDDAREPRFIETVARQGYRFIEPVGFIPEVEPRARRGRRLAAAAALGALVVLTAAIESNGRNQQHHDTAVALARAVHDFIF